MFSVTGEGMQVRLEGRRYRRRYRQFHVDIIDIDRFLETAEGIQVILDRRRYRQFHVDIIDIDRFLQTGEGMQVSISTSISTVSRRYHRYRQYFREYSGSFASISTNTTTVIRRITHEIKTPNQNQ